MVLTLEVVCLHPAESHFCRIGCLEGHPLNPVRYNEMNVLSNQTKSAEKQPAVGDYPTPKVEVKFGQFLGVVRT